MQADKINQYFLTNGKYFPEEKIPALRAKMSGFTESQESMLYGLSFHDPLVVELVSIFIGGLGIDIVKHVVCGAIGGIRGEVTAAKELG